MKKNVLQFIVLFARIACLIPIPVNAKEKYISWKGSDTFHVEGCPVLKNAPIADFVYYDSYKEAVVGEALEAAESGASVEVKKPCRVCKPGSEATEVILRRGVQRVGQTLPPGLVLTSI